MDRMERVPTERPMAFSRELQSDKLAWHETQVGSVDDDSILALLEDQGRLQAWIPTIDQDHTTRYPVPGSELIQHRLGNPIVPPERVTHPEHYRVSRRPTVQREASYTNRTFSM